MRRFRAELLEVMIEVDFIFLFGLELKMADNKRKLARNMDEDYWVQYNTIFATKYTWFDPYNIKDKNDRCVANNVNDFINSVNLKLFFLYILYE